MKPKNKPRNYAISYLPLVYDKYKGKQNMELKEALINILLVSLLSLLVIGTSIAQTQPLKNNSTNIESTDPYCNDGGYLDEAFGIDEDCTVSNSTIPAGVSDWVLIELRAVAEGASVEAATTDTVIDRQPAWLLQNGYVVDASTYTGGCEVNFDVNSATCPLVQFNFADDTEVSGKDLYVVVRHINHLDVISNTSMTRTIINGATRYTYDFTTAVTQARGGSLGLKGVDEEAAMYVGDVNRDENINAADYLQIHNDISSGSPPSLRSDINFDGTVGDGDFESSRLSENLGRTTQIP